MRTGAAFEAFLARLYTDKALQRVFQEGLPEEAYEAARSAGLSEEEARAAAAVDRPRLRLACESLEKKLAGPGGAGH
ncbi:MAG: hypothetical protein R2729_19070 [Bryobacteraceae bacterium]